MEHGAPSVAERRRLEKLAAEVPSGQWIVAPLDPEAEILSIAGPVSRCPLFAVVGSSPVTALQRLQAIGVRHRAHLAGGAPHQAAAGWTHPIGLLCLPAEAAHPRSLLATWGAHVVAGGHVLFYAGLAPHPAVLGLRPGYWTAHLRSGGGLFLLTRRPYG